jgi:hypothetical protein
MNDTTPATRKPSTAPMQRIGGNGAFVNGVGVEVDVGTLADKAGVLVVVSVVVGDGSIGVGVGRVAITCITVE